MLKYPSPREILSKIPGSSAIPSTVACIVEVYSNIVPPILGITGIIKPYLSKSSRMLTHPATNDSPKNANYPNLQFYSISIPATDYTLDSTTSEARVLRPGRYENPASACN